VHTAYGAFANNVRFVPFCLFDLWTLFRFSLIKPFFWPLSFPFFCKQNTTTALAWLYCLVWFLIQDAGKVLLYKLMYKYNICHINRQTSHVEHYHEAHFQVHVLRSYTSRSARVSPTAHCLVMLRSC
jgi:hypothetical protein